MTDLVNCQTATLKLLAEMTLKLDGLESKLAEGQARAHTAAQVAGADPAGPGAFHGGPAAQRPGAVVLGVVGREARSETRGEARSSAASVDTLAEVSERPRDPVQGSIFSETLPVYSAMQVGTRVRICGVQKEGFNDKKGVIIEDSQASPGRVAVRLDDGREIQAMRDKLVISIF